jgi:hypothetical protein
MSSGFVPELALRGWRVRDTKPANHRLEPDKQAGTRLTQVTPPMIPSIQYPARAADPPKSAMGPHEPEKRPRLELFANTGSLRWLRPAGVAVCDHAALDCAASIAHMGDCCATSRCSSRSIPHRRRMRAHRRSRVKVGNVAKTRGGRATCTFAPRTCRTPAPT